MLWFDGIKKNGLELFEIQERARLNFEILTSKIFKPILKSLLLSNDFENKLMMLLKN